MQMLVNNIFLVIKTNDQRLAIFDYICLIKYVILSIYFVVKNTKYLKLNVKILKKLLLNKSKNLISQQFYTRYNKQASIKIQINKFVFKN